MKIYFFKNFPKSISLLTFFIALISFKGDFLNAENLFEEIQIESSTKIEEDNSVIPTNPFEIVEMFRRANSMNDATKPTDAIDDALRSFNIIEQN